METSSGWIKLKRNWRQIIIILLTLVIIAISAFRIGGDDFVYAFNNNISSFQSLVILLLTVVLLSKTDPESQNRKLWLGMAIGWAFWVIAEWWWGIASLLSTEVPYPSGADLFWMLGYIPMYYALQKRSHSIPEGISSAQKTIMILLSIALVGVATTFIIAPILQSAEPDSLLETFFNILYPLGDMVLFIMVLRVAFKYEQGVNGFAWFWISFGYILNTFADLIFSYATIHDMYYPGGEVNFISSVGSDTLYSVSYMVILFGLSVIRSNRIVQTEAHEAASVLTPIHNTHVLIFTDKDNIVNDVSHNYSSIFSNSKPVGSPLASALGMPLETINELINAIRTKKILEEANIELNTRFGRKKARASGERLISPDGEYLGEIILISLFLEDHSLDDSVTEYEDSIIRSIIRKTGSKEKFEAKNLIINYYSAVAAALLELAKKEGGKAMENSILSRMQNQVKGLELPITIGVNFYEDTEALTFEQTGDVIPALFNTLEGIVSDILDPESVKLAEELVWDNFGVVLQKNIVYCKNKLGITEG